MTCRGRHGVYYCYPFPLYTLQSPLWNTHKSDTGQYCVKKNASRNTKTKE